MAKVMIVDDSLFMRNHIAKLLVKHGYETMAAENGEAAVRAYRRDSPDAVLMDITMPRKDGLEALMEICQLDPQAKVIMLTALVQSDDRAAGFAAGADDYLMKPFSTLQVLETIYRMEAAQ